MQVVILSPPRTGSSMMCHLVKSLGIDMGTRKKNNKPGICIEDIDFHRLNSAILKPLRSHFSSVPLLSDIQEQGKLYVKTIKDLVAKKNKKQKWGWKEPQTSLTIPVIHPFLDDPYYIVIKRSFSRAVSSAIYRSSKKTQKYNLKTATQLIKGYNDHIKTFIPGKNFVEISFDRLVTKKTSRDELLKLVRFLRFSEEHILKLEKLINYNMRNADGSNIS